MGGIGAIAVLIMTGVGMAGGAMMMTTMVIVEAGTAGGAMMMTTMVMVEAGTAGGAVMMMITTVPGIPRRFTLASRGGIACKTVKSRGEVTAPLPRR